MGYVLILNNESFKDESFNRIGSLHDVKRLKSVFHKFNFRIKVVNDPTVKDIRDNMEQLLSEELGTAHCLVVVIMTHGYENDVAQAQDGLYNITNDIMQSKVFQKYKNLPKIIITQACKVESKDAREYIENCKSANVSIDNWYRLDSTFEGGVAIRNQEGSPFIKILCEQLEKFGFELYIDEIGKKVLVELKEHVRRKTSLNQTPRRVDDSTFKSIRLGQPVRNRFDVTTNRAVDREFEL